MCRRAVVRRTGDKPLCYPPSPILRSCFYFLFSALLHHSCCLFCFRSAVSCATTPCPVSQADFPRRNDMKTIMQCASDELQHIAMRVAHQSVPLRYRYIVYRDVCHRSIRSSRHMPFCFLFYLLRSRRFTLCFQARKRS